MTDTTTTTEVPEDWRAWRAARDAELAAPHGWLSLTALHWLTTAPTALDGLPGLWWADDDGLHLDPAGDTSVLLDGSSVTSPAVLWVPGRGAAPDVRHGDRLLELVGRGAGNVGVRVRDPQAPALRAFDGVPTFDYDPSWRVVGTYRPYPEPDRVPVGSAAPRVQHVRTVSGEVDLVLAGVPHTLQVSSGHAWSVAFRDATTGGTTNPVFRQVVLDGEPGETVVVDLNRAANPPCAFSDHGTCPLPPAGNVVRVAVTAGEKTPAGR